MDQYRGILTAIEPLSLYDRLIYSNMNQWLKISAKISVSTANG